MRLVTFQTGNEARLGILAGQGVLDLNRAYRWGIEKGWVDKASPAAIRSLPEDMKEFLAMGEPARVAAQQCLLSFQPQLEEMNFLAALQGKSIYFPNGEYVLRAPIQRPGKIICIGMNYPDGKLEGMIPEYPVVFLKAASSVIGTGEAIVIPPVTRDVVYEAELGVVIGSLAKCLSREESLIYVAGYTLANDVGARDLEKRTSQWTTGKLMDTFCPLGPALVTRDEAPQLNRMEITTRINGRPVQQGNTGEMFFDVPYLVSYLSHLCTLEPGDVILTGSPKIFEGRLVQAEPLRDGDCIEVQIGHLGVLKNQVTAELKERR